MKRFKPYRLGILLGLLSAGVLATEAPQPSSVTGTAEQAQSSKAKPAVANLNQVNINTATAAEIQDKLVGIGAKKAQAIVEYREKNGRFLNAEQLTEVSGIGKATLDKNRDRIVLE